MDDDTDKFRISLERILPLTDGASNRFCIACHAEYLPVLPECPSCLSILHSSRESRRKFLMLLGGENDDSDDESQIEPELAQYSDPDEDSPDDTECVRCGAWLEPDEKTCPRCLESLSPDPKRQRWLDKATEFLESRHSSSTRYCPACLAEYRPDVPACRACSKPTLSLADLTDHLEHETGSSRQKRPVSDSVLVMDPSPPGFDEIVPGLQHVFDLEERHVEIQEIPGRSSTDAKGFAIYARPHDIDRVKRLVHHWSSEQKEGQLPLMQPRLADAKGRPSCSRCGWVVQEWTEWHCDCGQVWNTFTPCVTCPKCSKYWDRTQCHMCWTWSADKEWLQPGA